jgi:uridine phosphorylase
MAYPNHKNKQAEKALFTPHDFWAYLKKRGRANGFKAPSGVILCYQSNLMKHILDNHQTTRGEGYHQGLYLLNETGGNVAVMGSFGIGAPAAVAVFEELIALGPRKFVSVGTAGSLQKDIRIGDLIVCEQAIRDEGTSHHYLKASKYSRASRHMTERIVKSLNFLKRKHRIGTSWTIDAPYRETLTEVKRYQREGVATVEMEAAALFAVAAYRQVEMGAMFTVSDSLADLEWKPVFHFKRTGKGLETIYKAALMALQD